MANKPATYATDHSSSVLHGFCIRWPVVPWLVHSGSSERGHCTRGWAYSTDMQTSFASSQALYLLFPTHTHTHTLSLAGLGTLLWFVQCGNMPQQFQLRDTVSLCRQPPVAGLAVVRACPWLRVLLCKQERLISKMPTNLT